MNIWIEKTIVGGRIDRMQGDRSLGKALWSPQLDKRGGDIYKNMRLVNANDLILHLVDNKSIYGISKVKNKAVKTTGIEGTDWKGPSYLIELKDFAVLNPQIKRESIFNEKYESELRAILRDSEVFYNKDLNLRQGAYLTPCSIKLFSLINSIYFELSSTNLPYTEKIKFQKLPSSMQEEEIFNYKSFHQKTKEAGLKFSEKIVSRFVASLCTKPFVICSGLSGSGKTKLAQSFVKWICKGEEQYKMVPVGADWTNREPLLGYPNGLDPDKYVFPDSGVLELMLNAGKPENKNKPYFLILDEMNLSHVERYFADFLSIMESQDTIKLYSGAKRGDLEHEISWPENLFIIGTVNIDETTYMFSPKVLDRANVIEFRISENEITEYLAEPGNLNMEIFINKAGKQGYGAAMAKDFLDKTNAKITSSVSTQETLVSFFNELRKCGAEFGYRSASEINRLIAVLESLTKDDLKWDQKDVSADDFIDIAIMQKLLPKLHGSRNKLTKILPVLGALCLSDKDKIQENYFEKIDSIKYSEDENIKYGLSLEKICRMYKNAIENGYASYAEA